MSSQDEQRTVSSRKRNILYLIDKFLADAGLSTTLACLRSEAHLQPEYEICDNIDLDTMYLEYCSYFHLKFGKNPRIIKKINKTERKPLPSTRKSASRKKDLQGEICAHMDQVCNPSFMSSLQVFQISAKTDEIQDNYREPIRRPFEEHENYSPEWKELADVVCRDLVKKNYNLKWCNVYGNSQAVAVIKEAVLVPIEFPHLFNANLKPWKAILLHGPPGSGKTLIAKTLSSETYGKVSFFNVCSSTIISKWRGESEKIIRVLFEVARFYAPSIIFIDEIEGLTSKRDSVSEHEASKRLKNEFLSLLDGMGDENNRIFILANTNLPWEIDAAFLRRFEKRILIELPNIEERKQLVNFFLPESKTWSDIVFSDLLKKCEGFTGDELRIACKEAAMHQIREFLTVGKGKAPALKNISETDLKHAISQIQPTSQELMKKHIEWNKMNGSK